MINTNKKDEYTEVHISNIRAGDAVIHNKELVTVGNKDLRYSSFMGISIFGDTYNLGTKKVKRVYCMR